MQNKKVKLKKITSKKTFLIKSTLNKKVESNVPTFLVTDVPQYEADALINFYNSGNGDNWNNNTGWLTDPVVGNWSGITVSGGHVTKIRLIEDSNITSDIKYLEPLKMLQKILLYTTSCLGDIKILRNFNLIQIRAWITYLYGDVNIIQHFPNINEFYLSDLQSSLTYTQTTLPYWDGAKFDINGSGMTSADVSQLVQDLDISGSINLVLKIEDNEPPNQTGLDAIASLEGKGCTITYDTP